MRAIKIANRKRFYSFILVSISILFLCLLILNNEDVQSQSIIKYDMVTVQGGDTIWDIAKLYNKDKNKVLRQFVYEIKKENKIYGDFIEPNQKIAVPRTF
jgi:hypothetical protein